MFFNGSVVITQTCRTPRLWSHFRFCFFYFFSYSPCHRHLLKTLCRFIVGPFTHKELFLLHCLFSGSLFRCCSPELLAAKSGCFCIQHKLVRSHYNVLRKCTHTHALWLEFTAILTFTVVKVVWDKPEIISVCQRHCRMTRLSFILLSWSHCGLMLLMILCHRSKCCFQQPLGWMFIKKDENRG